ncbi:MAG: hypothetical protein IT458_03140 [Planctomycetes bacterium]|nr:hypothetical protein [Planctomycetota bacterium]
MSKMRMRWGLGVVALLLGLGACGGGGGSGGTPANLAGYWQLYLTPTGSTVETGPSPVFLSQNGATVDGAAITGTVSGNSFTMTSNAIVFTTSFTGTVSGGIASGTMSISGIINATGTFRLVPMTPTGTMSATGTVQGQSVNMTTTAAIGSRDYTDPGLTMLDEVEIAMAYGSEHLEIDFSAAGMAVGALGVPGTVTATVLYRNDTTTTELAASSGTVTVTRYDGSGCAGSFTLNLPGGGTLTGSFDVSWNIAAYDP